MHKSEYYCDHCGKRLDERRDHVVPARRVRGREGKRSAVAERFCVWFEVFGRGHACFFFKLFRKMRAKRVCSTPMAAGARSRKFMSPMTVSMKYCARSSSSSPA